MIPGNTKRPDRFESCVTVVSFDEIEPSTACWAHVDQDPNGCYRLTNTRLGLCWYHTGEIQGARNHPSGKTVSAV